MQPTAFVRSLPEGYSLRPATLQDLENVLRLRIAQNLADYGESGLTASSLRETWLSSGFHIGLDHWLVLDPQGQPAAYGEVRGMGEPATYQAIMAISQGSDLSAGPDPAVANVLFGVIEQRAVELSGTRRPQISCRISTRNTSFQQIVESAGYRLNLTFNIMEIDLTVPPPAPVLPPGVTIREFVPEQDDQDVYRVDEEAGEDKGYHRPLSFEAWCKRMGRHTPLFDPHLWFLAYAGEHLAGVALNFYAPDTETAWVDHLSVLRASRKRGIGLALLLHSLNEFHQRCYPFARLSVDSHSLTHAPKLYEKAGFKTVMGYHIYSKD